MKNLLCLKSILDDLPEAVIIFEDSKINYFNEKVKSVLGQPEPDANVNDHIEGQL